MNTSSQSFAVLPLSPAMQANLAQLGFTEMTAIQALSLPKSLAGSDLIAQAQTGSGKTVAFGLSLLHRLDGARLNVQSLVLCPTRELADQVAEVLRQLARAADNIKILTVCGGVPMRNQIASLEFGAHVIVGTPGRILDHLERGTLDLSQLNTLVLDEADRMLDMGFVEDIATVVKAAPKNRQTLLFSATWPEGVAGLAQRFMRDPQTVKAEAAAAPRQIQQIAFEVSEDYACMRSRNCSCTTARRARWPFAIRASNAGIWLMSCRRKASLPWPCTANWSSVSGTRC